MDVKIILVNTFIIGSFSTCKDTIHVCFQSNVVYFFGYVYSSCTSEYIGSRIRCLAVRACEHMGISFRIKYPIAKSPQSVIRDHYEQYDITVENFKILDSAKEVDDLRILESIYFFQT